MAHLDKEMIKYLTQLSRIHCTEEQQDSLLKDLESILGHIEQLDELKTGDTPACNHVLEDMVNVMREDEIGETMSRETFLSNAPSQVSGLIRVPTVIKQEPK